MLGLSFLAKKDIQDEPELNDTALLKEKINFNKLIDECIHSLNHLPEFQKISFRKEIEPELTFHTEWTLLNAIVQNLIENGIKYSAEENPFVNIKVWSENGGVAIRVADNGQGISIEHQSKIFEMFYRATHQSRGTGLGLYILKRSVDKLQGQIDIESEPGIGSTFTVKLPE
jgi:signal transduction histidine kinase